ncbi:DUF2490 domain-containing protein [Spirosoma agri]|uniref:DUF2490 domain-containing protein n=1 Tax=Spirosoma agri TaxID=1987381 RepID=A0A6M0IJ98_9BACT|nr:DUF2490 domain-containing protein [Spirosoma agri]NEU68370.1 DUF2490 domain-containing protein [Spirosoma agri]
MSIRHYTILTVLFFLIVFTANGQSPRLRDTNALAWFVYTGDHQISQKWAVHTEYQWRRVGGLGSAQQQLARLGLVHKLTDRVKVSGGYTYFQSYRYGAYPEVLGRPEPESRIYEDITLTDKLGRLGLEHRVRLEQRWLGSRDQTGQGPVQQWEYQNRIRYQLSVEFPLQGPTIDDGEWYLNAFDELFIGFGRNVDDNVFNQNRLSGGLGYQITDKAKLELNYLYQIRQHAEPDPMANRSVVELNQGFRLNIVYGLNFTREP